VVHLCVERVFCQGEHLTHADDAHEMAQVLEHDYADYTKSAQASKTQELSIALLY
jgi:hypothetical protein